MLQGSVTKMGKKERRVELFLFTDLLVVGSLSNAVISKLALGSATYKMKACALQLPPSCCSPSAAHGDVRSEIPINDAFSFLDEPDSEDKKNRFQVPCPPASHPSAAGLSSAAPRRARQIVSPVECFTLATSSPEEKKKWLEALQKCVERERGAGKADGVERSVSSSLQRFRSRLLKNGASPRALRVCADGTGVRAASGLIREPADEDADDAAARDLRDLKQQHGDREESTTSAHSMLSTPPAVLASVPDSPVSPSALARPGARSRANVRKPLPSSRAKSAKPFSQAPRARPAPVRAGTERRVGAEAPVPRSAPRAKPAAAVTSPTSARGNLRLASPKAAAALSPKAVPAVASAPALNLEAPAVPARAAPAAVAAPAATATAGPPGPAAPRMASAPLPQAATTPSSPKSAHRRNPSFPSMAGGSSAVAIEAEAEAHHGALVRSAAIAGESGHFAFAGPEHLLQDDAQIWSSLPNRDLRGAAPWVAFDLGAAKTLVAVGLRSRALPSGVRTASLQSAETAAGDWVPRARIHAVDGGRLQTFRVKPTTARYWRLVFLRNHGEQRPTYCRFFVEHVCFFESMSPVNEAPSEQSPLPSQSGAAKAANGGAPAAGAAADPAAAGAALSRT